MQYRLALYNTSFASVFNGVQYRDLITKIRKNISIRNKIEKMQNFAGSYEAKTVGRSLIP